MNVPWQRQAKPARRPRLRRTIPGWSLSHWTRRLIADARAAQRAQKLARRVNALQHWLLTSVVRPLGGLLLVGSLSALTYGIFWPPDTLRVQQLSYAAIEADAAVRYAAALQDARLASAGAPVALPAASPAMAASGIARGSAAISAALARLRAAAAEVQRIALLAPKHASVPGASSPASSPVWVLGSGELVREIQVLDTDVDAWLRGSPRTERVPAGVEARMTRLAQGLAKTSALTDRTALIAALEAAQAQHRHTVAWLATSLALMGILGFVLLWAAQTHRHERRTLRQRARALAEAQRNALARNALLGMVSHELRGPLQQMLGYADLITLSPDDASRLALQEQFVHSITAMSDRLNNIARYTSLESGVYERRIQRIDPAGFLQRVIAEHAAGASQRGKSIVLAHAPQDDVFTDDLSLHQIVSNFLANAIKYSEGSEIRVRATLRGQSLHRPAQELEIAIEDEGPGLPEGELDSMWQPFIRGSRSKSAESGSGLGLAVVRMLASSAGWQVGVRTSKDQGSAFYVRVPLQLSESSTGQV